MSKTQIRATSPEFNPPHAGDKHSKVHAGVNFIFVQIFINWLAVNVTHGGNPQMYHLDTSEPLPEGISQIESSRWQ